jgi:uncharacterized protein
MGASHHLPSMRNYLRFLAALFGLIFLAILVFISIQSYKAGLMSAHPPRQAVEPIPADLLDGRVYRAVEFTTADGVRISAWYLPPAPGNPWTLLLAHGYASNRRMLLPEANLLAPHGYGLLMIDFRAHGLSGDANSTIGDHERRDLTAALDYLQAQPETKKIGGIGFSMGSAALTMAAADDTRLEAVILEDGYAGYRDEIFYRARVFGPLSQLPALLAVRRMGVDIDEMRPADALCRISPRPVLLVYGEHDLDVPLGTPQQMLDAACQPSELWIVPGIGHENPASADPAEYEQRLLAFFPAD